MIGMADVEGAQKAWGEGIVAIANAHKNDGDYVGIASNHVNTLYAYQMGPVLFKPTLAAIDQFRPTFDTALSYFVASNNACPEDKGFAIKGWTNVRFENSEVIIDGGTALAMGNYYFTDPQGAEVKVEYTFGYIEDDQGNLRIQLHHSSMPAESE
jgi:hypothetical protein|tara:strand:+ start:1863 stop:2327 length:465 start_codon:yes stop_codon:yes gene_type:complete